MQAIGTIITKNGTVFGVFQVKPDVIGNNKQANNYRTQLRNRFSTLPIVLISRTDQGEVLFDGQNQLIEQIKDDHFAAYNWRQYHL